MPGTYLPGGLGGARHLFSEAYLLVPGTYLLVPGTYLLVPGTYLLVPGTYLPVLMHSFTLESLGRNRSPALIEI